MTSEEEDVLAVMAGKPTIRELLETILQRLEKLEANSYPQQFTNPYAPAPAGRTWTTNTYTTNHT